MARVVFVVITVVITPIRLVGELSGKFTHMFKLT